MSNGNGRNFDGTVLSQHGQDSLAVGRALQLQVSGNYSLDAEGTMTFHSFVWDNRKKTPVTYTTKAGSCTCIRWQKILAARLVAKVKAMQGAESAPIATFCKHMALRELELGTLNIDDYNSKLLSEGIVDQQNMEKEREEFAPLHVTLDNIEFAPADKAAAASAPDEWVGIIQVYDPSGLKAVHTTKEGRQVELPTLKLRIPAGVTQVQAGAAAVAFFARKGRVLSWKSGSMNVATPQGKAAYDELPMVELS
jgi:hypothetical protein